MVSTATSLDLPKATPSATRGSNDVLDTDYMRISVVGSNLPGEAISDQVSSQRLWLLEPLVQQRPDPHVTLSNLESWERGMFVLRHGQMFSWSVAKRTPSNPQTNASVAGQYMSQWLDQRPVVVFAPKSDPLNITRQLDDLRDLEDGWADGMQYIGDWGNGFGKAPSHEGLRWLAKQFERFYPQDAPRPYIYPTPEGGISAEWPLGNVASSLEVDIDAHSAEWFRVDLESSSSDDRVVNLDDSADWRWVVEQLRRDSNQAG